MLYIVNQLITICALAFIVFILNSSGYLDKIISLIVKYYRDNKWLFHILIITTIICTVIFNNYFTVLILFLIILKLRTQISLNRPTILSYLLTIGFLADAANLVNNPINSITKEYFQIPWLRYLLILIPIQIIVIISSITVVYLYFIRYISSDVPREKIITLDNIAIDLKIFYPLSLLILNKIFPSFSALISLIVVIILIFFTTETKIQFNLLRQIPWLSLGIVFMLYTIGIILGKLGLIEMITLIIKNNANWGITFASITTGLLATLQSIVINNFPAITNNNLAIDRANITDSAIKEIMIYGNIIGCVIGAKITPVGSISTLLWYGQLKNQNLGLHWLRYVTINLALTLPVLFIALLFLAIWLPWLIV